MPKQLLASVQREIVAAQARRIWIESAKTSGWRM